MFTRLYRLQALVNPLFTFESSKVNEPQPTYDFIIKHQMASGTVSEWIVIYDRPKTK